MKKRRTTIYSAAITAGSCAVTGVVTALVVVLYKWCAHRAVTAAERGYHLLREHWWCLPILLAVLGGVAILLSWIYRREPSVRGGGLPTAIAAVRGQTTLRRWITPLGVFGISLLSFLLGVPLGTEGPSVLIGAAVGGMIWFGKRDAAGSRYAMSGGASAGFAVATGAPLAGVLFALEETHRRVTPKIVASVGISVACAALTNAVISPLLGVNVALFDPLSLKPLTWREWWLPLTVGAAVGLLSVGFLWYYRAVRCVTQLLSNRLSLTWRIWLVLAATAVTGCFCFSAVSSGHELTAALLCDGAPLWWLAMLLVVRATLTLSANVNSITGGTFLPQIAIGAVFAALLGGLATRLPLLGEDCYTVVLMLGIAAAVAGLMRLPFTAVAFAVEALSGYGHILPIVIAAATAYVITRLCGVSSITDSVLEGFAPEETKKCDGS